MNKEKIKEFWNKYKFLIISSGVLIGVGFIFNKKGNNKELLNIIRDEELNEDLSVDFNEFKKFFVTRDNDLSFSEAHGIKNNEEVINFIEESLKIRKDFQYDDIDIFIGFNPNIKD